MASQHRFGLAADFTAAHFGSAYEVACAILASPIQFDQMIYEFESWVHISFVRREPRRSVLSIFSPGRYLQGIRQSAT